jgi:hypothetical protein
MVWTYSLKYIWKHLIGPLMACSLYRRTDFHWCRSWFSQRVPYIILPGYWAGKVSSAISSFSYIQRRMGCRFLPSPRRHSSEWALASWTVSLHSSLFFICSDDETSKGTVKRWEDCGWKRSWPTYFCSLISLHPSEADYMVSKQFSFYGVRLLASRPAPNLKDQGIPLLLAPTPWPVRHGWSYQ